MSSDMMAKSARYISTPKPLSYIELFGNVRLGYGQMKQNCLSFVF